MRLCELLQDVKTVDTRVDTDMDITKIFSDSRKAIKGGAFVAIKGLDRNGNDYIESIKENTGCVITDDYDAFCKYENTVLVENARSALSHMWNNFYGSPTNDMKLIGITGTNGKTSCAYYLYNILKKAGKRVGLISTIECLINGKIYKTDGGSEVSDISSAMTTPDPECLYKIFAEMRDAGVEYAVMEASSHALELSKLAPLEFEIGVFTNLSSEHLDFHNDMELYFSSKRKLFASCNIGIVNIDDEYGKRLYSENYGKLISCSTLNSDSDFYASHVLLGENGIEYSLKAFDSSFAVKGNICGGFSVYNTMLSIACAIKLGIEQDRIFEGILETVNIKGRLEKIEGKRIFIDYAHTPYAMEKCLLGVREMMPDGRIIALFGCGGNRDKGKRAKMGKIASDLADTVIITSDNSRNESPVEIIRDILCGIGDDTDYMVVPSREKAIRLAMENMKEKDTLVLIGKGHEEYEINKNGKHYFSEREIVKAVLENDKD